MGKADPPTPPNPYQTAAAQTGTNVSTAVANAYLGNVNQNTPSGSLSYAPTNNYQWTDPSTGQTYTIPTFTATQTLSPSEQNLFNLNQSSKTNLAQIGANQSAAMIPYLSGRVDVSGAPSAGSAQNIANAPRAATSYDPGGQIQTQLGGDFTADRQRVEDALMARMNPQLQQEQQRVQQQLADQGIRYGSQAYSDAMLNYSKQANDARYGAIAQGGQEQQRLFEQALGMGTFANQAQAQQNQQNAALAGFGNAGLAQQLAQQQSAFNASQAGRNQYMQEQYAARNQPLNEISAMLSQSQVQQPNFINTPGAQIPTTDIAGLVNQNFQQQFGNYQQQSTNQNALLGGILGLGAGALKASDRRVKENIVKMGTVFADVDHDESKPLPIYQYTYKDDPASTQHVGPMAQDVEKIDPHAVKDIKGTKYIDQRRVMGSILRAG